MSTEVQKRLKQYLHAASALEQVILAPLVWLCSLIAALLLPARIATLEQPVSQKKQNADNMSLFPSISNVAIDRHEVNEESDEPSSSRPIPCSTGITTRLLPFKNAKGEIEWAFTEDMPPGTELEAFRIHHEPSKVGAAVKKDTDDILSPVTSSSSNNESVVYDKPSNMPQVNTPSSTSSDDEKASGKEDGAGESSDGHVHQCPHCSTSFKMRGYLTRHMKKHASEKAYKCPFHKASVYKDENDVVHKCHPTGGFSRRDTYKTHLKSRHFKYPDNTPIKAKSTSAGNCSMCGEWFENGEIWCEMHVEGGECKYLPAGFKGKSRIKNRIKKQLAQMQKQERKVKQRAKKNSQSPVMGTPNSMTTPMPPTTSSCDYHDSPSSTSSSMHSQHNTQQSIKHELPMDMATTTTTLAEIQSALSPDDYDDRWCLDTEQLIFPIPTPDMVLRQHSEMMGAPMATQSYVPQAYPQMYQQPMQQQMPQQVPQQGPHQIYEPQQQQQVQQEHTQKFYRQQLPAHIRTQMQMQMPLGFHGDENSMIREKGY